MMRHTRTRQQEKNKQTLSPKTAYGKQPQETSMSPPVPEHKVLQMQRQFGNRRVSAMLGGTQRSIARTPAVQRTPVEFGLAESGPINTYAHKVFQWSQDPANAGKPIRAAVDYIVSLVKAELKANGVPVPQFLVGNAGAGLGGVFQWQPWAIGVDDSDIAWDPSITTVGQLDVSSLVSVVGTVWHEARHAEQFWLMARMLGGKGMTGTQINAHTGIKLSVANKAAAIPLKKASSDIRSFMEFFGLGQLVDINDAMAAMAQKWYDINFGVHKSFTDMREQLNVDVLTLKSFEPAQRYTDQYYTDLYATFDPIMSRWDSDFLPNVVEPEVQRLDALKGGDKYAAELHKAAKDIRDAIKTMLSVYKKGSKSRSRAKKLENALEDVAQADYLGYRVYADERDAWMVEAQAQAAYNSEIDAYYEAQEE